MTELTTNDLEVAVRDALDAGTWRLEPTTKGGRTFVATARGARVFVKVGVDADLLRRLAALDIVPKLVASRPHRDVELVVQEFVQGDHPEPQWVDEHVAEVCGLIGRCHSDPSLGLGVDLLTATDAVRLLAQRIGMLAINVPVLTKQLAETLDNLAASAVTIPTDELRLTHGDPNTSNLLRSVDESLYLIDWDEARVSDPVRDVGQILWWYVRPEHWDQGLQAAGLPADRAVLERVYWWAGAESLDVCLEHLERADQGSAADFALDALAASRGEFNPRAWWKKQSKN